MEMPIDELIDKATIFKLKSEKVGDKFKAAFDAYMSELKDIDTSDWFDKLYKLNSELWDEEAKLADEENLEEAGRIALRIRKLNNQRVDIKAEIVRAFGSGFEDSKHYYSK
jgi:hypothetical protein